MYKPKDDIEAIFRQMYGTPTTKAEILQYNKMLARTRRAMAEEEGQETNENTD